MNKQVRFNIAFGIIIILSIVFIATFPFERPIITREFTSLEIYPTYYYTDFTIDSLNPNPELSLSLNIDVGDNYTSCMIIYALYQLSLEEFEGSFNATLVKETMMSSNWDSSDFGAIWAGWHAGTRVPPHYSPIPSGEFVFVFWIEPDEPIADWSATFTASLRTRLL